MKKQLGFTHIGLALIAVAFGSGFLYSYRESFLLLHPGLSVAIATAVFSLGVADKSKPMQIAGAAAIVVSMFCLRELQPILLGFGLGLLALIGFVSCVMSILGPFITVGRRDSSAASQSSTLT